MPNLSYDQGVTSVLFTKRVERINTEKSICKLAFKTFAPQIGKSVKLHTLKCTVSPKSALSKTSIDFKREL